MTNGCGRGRAKNADALVRYGSLADICRAKRHVRFTPESGHVQCTSPCPLCANSGHFLCGVQVNDQIEFGCLFHTQIARVGALQHSIYNASWGLWTRP